MGTGCFPLLWYAARRPLSEPVTPEDGVQTGSVAIVNNMIADTLLILFISVATAFLGEGKNHPVSFSAPCSNNCLSYSRYQITITMAAVSPKFGYLYYRSCLVTGSGFADTLRLFDLLLGFARNNSSTIRDCVV